MCTIFVTFVGQWKNAKKEDGNEKMEKDSILACI